MRRVIVKVIVSCLVTYPRYCNLIKKASKLLQSSLQGRLYSEYLSVSRYELNYVLSSLLIISKY